MAQRKVVDVLRTKLAVNANKCFVMTRQLGHHRKDGGAVEHRQSLVSVGRGVSSFSESAVD
jgi:hypothetical protein